MCVGTKLILQPEGQESPVVAVCCCGSEHPEGECIPVRPGTPWWKALQEADVDDLVVVHLPNKELHLKLVAVQDN
jgi:hypothetical protein